jgi:hypothetical protein
MLCEPEDERNVGIEGAASGAGRIDAMNAASRLGHCHLLRQGQIDFVKVPDAGFGGTDRNGHRGSRQPGIPIDVVGFRPGKHAPPLHPPGSAVRNNRGAVGPDSGVDIPLGG